MRMTGKLTWSEQGKGREASDPDFLFSLLLNCPLNSTSQQVEAVALPHTLAEVGSESL
jgi:hypothetical protein